MTEFCGDDAPEKELGEPLSHLPSPAPLDKRVYERLNARLLGEDEGPESTLLISALQRFGQLLREWRIQKHLTRRQVAEKLGMDVVQLVVLENGLATAGDIHENQLNSLLAWLLEDEKLGEVPDAELLKALELCLKVQRD